jgi:hypothetical protein
MILTISASQVARIIGMSHQHPLDLSLKLGFCTLPHLQVRCRMFSKQLLTRLELGSKIDKHPLDMQVKGSYREERPCTTV